MEIVTPDTSEIAAQRAYEAVRRIGRVLEYKQESYVEGKVYTDGYPALLIVEWHPHRDGERIRLDISASSNDELSKAADAALYRFIRTFKEITPEDVHELPKRRARKRAMVIGGLAAAGALCAAVAHFLHLTPF